MPIAPRRRPPASVLPHRPDLNLSRPAPEPPPSSATPSPPSAPSLRLQTPPAAVSPPLTPPSSPLDASTTTTTTTTTPTTTPTTPWSLAALGSASNPTTQNLTRPLPARPRLPCHRPFSPPFPCPVSGSTLGSPPRSLATAQRPTSPPEPILRRSQRKITPSSNHLATPSPPGGPHSSDLTNQRSSPSAHPPPSAPSLPLLTNRRRAKPRRVPANVPCCPTLPPLQPLPLKSQKPANKKLSKRRRPRPSRCPSPTAGLRPFSNLTLSPPRSQDHLPDSKLSPSLFLSASGLSDQTGRVFSFSDQASSPIIFFHFPPPTPSRHLPPPYPGSLPPSPPSSHLPSPIPQSHHSFHQSLPLPPPPPPPSSSSSSSPHASWHRQPNTVAAFPRQQALWLPSCCTLLHQHYTGRIKRLLSPSDRPQNFIKTKKSKLLHLHFRSPLVLSSLPLIFFKMPNGLVPDSRLRATSPCFIPPSHAPRWLSSPASAEGRASGLCPSEGLWTGTGQGWQPHPAGGKVFYPSQMHSAPMPATPSSPSSSRLTDLLAPCPVIHQPLINGMHYAGPPMLSLRPPNVSQAGPLKAHLLTILRMRSNMGPGEASLRFKKWVFWNAWTRREQERQNLIQRQLAMPPIIHPIIQPKVRVETQTWTGNEVFDENGDLIKSESIGPSEEYEEEEEEEGSDAQNAQPVLMVSGHPTPPQSPVDNPAVPTVMSRAVSEVNIRKQHDDRLPTPPPSPPNGPSLNVVGCHA